MLRSKTFRVLDSVTCCSLHQRRVEVKAFFAHAYSVCHWVLKCEKEKKKKLAKAHWHT